MDNGWAGNGVGQRTMICGLCLWVYGFIGFMIGIMVLVLLRLGGILYTRIA